MNVTPSRTALAAAFLIVLGIYALIIRPMEADIGDRYADLENTRATLERSLVLARRLPELERERARLTAVLARVHLADSRTVLVDRFLHAVARTAGHDAVSILNIVTDPRPSTDISIDITVRGPYENVIRAVRDLNATDVAARIALASLGNAQLRPGSRPQLDATFHVVLLRETDESTIRDPRPV